MNIPSFQLDDRIALVTGAGSGIGFALSLALVGYVQLAAPVEWVVAAAALLFLVYFGRTVCRQLTRIELDEAGIRSDAPLQRTWGAKGQTPIVKTSGQRQSVSAISAVTARGEFWYSVYTGRLNAMRFVEFLKQFMRHRRRPVFLVVDGLPAHKAKLVATYVQSLKGKLELVGGELK